MIPPLVLIKTANHAKRLEIIENINDMIQHNDRHGDPPEVVNVMLSHTIPTFATIFYYYSTQYR